MKARIAIGGIGGRMGSRIAALAAEDPDLILVGGIVRELIHQPFEEGLNIGLNASQVMGDVDVLIEFTEPEATLAHLKEIADKKGKAVVIGTTGFDEVALETIRQFSQRLPIVLDSNFALGVALLKLSLVAGLKQTGQNFDCEIVEIHRKGKRDAPSGTAKDLAQSLMPILGEKPTISSLRIGEVPGEHIVYLSRQHEVLEFRHQTFSRDAFALGALRAAKWIKGKAPGLYRFSDVLIS